MRRLLARFKISRSLDEDGRLSPFWARVLSRSPEDARFQQEATALEALLRESSQEAPPPLPPSAHRAILAAVKAAHPPRPARHSPLLTPALAWASVAVIVVLVAAATLALRRSQPPGAARVQTPQHPLKADWSARLAETLDLVPRASAAAPATVTAPLAQELASLEADARSTAQFILASIP
jgi:hypothetical protein